jgi:hypothetical protein
MQVASWSDLNLLFKPRAVADSIPSRQSPTAQYSVHSRTWSPIVECNSNGTLQEKSANRNIQHYFHL